MLPINRKSRKFKLESMSADEGVLASPARLYAGASPGTFGSSLSLPVAAKSSDSRVSSVSE
jgi:hypothetical protein